ncbi:unnamed protein product [Leuciscus chuanchicus]
MRHQHHPVRPATVDPRHQRRQAGRPHLAHAVHASQWPTCSCNIHIGQKEIEQVDSYVYLSQELTAGYKNNCELARRRRAAWVSYASIAEVVTNKADAPLHTHLFNSTVLPAMLYGAKTWSLTTADRQKLAVTERVLEQGDGRRQEDRPHQQRATEEDEQGQGRRQPRRTGQEALGRTCGQEFGRAMNAGRDRMAASRHQKTTRPPRNPMAGLAQTRYRQRLDGSGQGPKSLVKLLWPASKDRNTGRLKMKNGKRPSDSIYHHELGIGVCNKDSLSLFYVLLVQ